MLQKQTTVDFFLGSLSPSGFTGWFRQAADEPGIRPYFIKSGPGCGKSTLMSRVAEADTRSACIQLLHCSSDPASLDGAYLPSCGAILLDATAPHTLDCKYPGAAERVVSLYDALDNEELTRRRCEVLALGGKNTVLLKQAAAHFALCCALLSQRRALAAATLYTAPLEEHARRLGSRTMPLKAGCCPGQRQHRLLSAPTPGGPTVFYDTIPALADTLYAIKDEYGAAAPRLLACLADHAQAAGYDAILCHCPTDQTLLDHLFIPELRLAFVTANCWHPMLFVDQHTIHAARWYDADALAERRSTLRQSAALAEKLLAMTCQDQQAAKTVHDALERYYVAACDFSAVDARRIRLQQELFGS